jgi:hypothetical protein
MKMGRTQKSTFSFGLTTRVATARAISAVLAETGKTERTPAAAEHQHAPSVTAIGYVPGIPRISKYTLTDGERNELDSDCGWQRLYTILCLFGPLEPWFDKTWRPGEIELVNQPRRLS